MIITLDISSMPYGLYTVKDCRLYYRRLLASYKLLPRAWKFNGPQDDSPSQSLLNSI